VSGIFFKLARCGYTLRVTSQASYSPEYITSTQKNHEHSIYYLTGRMSLYACALCKRRITQMNLERNNVATILFCLHKLGFPKGCEIVLIFGTK
jgi:hypothetical protein